MGTFLHWIAENGNNIAEYKLGRNAVIGDGLYEGTNQATIDADAFFGALTCGTGSFQAFRTG